VPNASISIRNSETGAEQVISAGPAGSFSIPDLPSGRYHVVVSHPGFAVYTRRGVPAPGTLDVILSLGQISEALVVSGKRPQTQPAPPAPRRIPVGGNVQPVKVLYAPKPVYPARSEAGGVEGRVLLRTVIKLDGSVAEPGVISAPNSELGAAAMDAVRLWRYQPAMLNGQPVEVTTTISVDFRLDP
jgi:TonB family protein